MSWQLGLMLAMGALVALYVLLAVFTINPRDDAEDWREFNRDQAKRRVAEQGRRVQMGMRR